MRDVRSNTRLLAGGQWSRLTLIRLLATPLKDWVLIFYLSMISSRAGKYEFLGAQSVAVPLSGGGGEERPCCLT